MYATSKLAADFLTVNFHDAYGVPAVVTRMFNTYGPRQNPRYITGTIITQALERDVVEIGNLEPERDFVYCGDSVRAHLLVGIHGRPGDVYCFGQGEHIAIGDWAAAHPADRRGGGLLARQRELVSRAERFRPGASDVMALRCDSTRLTELTGWRPRLSWEDGVLARSGGSPRAAHSGWLESTGWVCPRRTSAVPLSLALSVPQSDSAEL